MSSKDLCRTIINTIICMSDDECCRMAFILMHNRSIEIIVSLIGATVKLVMDADGADSPAGAARSQKSRLLVNCSTCGCDFMIMRPTVVNLPVLANFLWN
ncbi:hypothetical protein OJAV_G00159950 [Oryzias javanicus]|uniref:Uncharacterized protein n=1 Tax=Oryzias javanicus TaxID=123683 RepID=A0A3S2PJW6_ORYJA|nr:hypothetical protein OJAV_G00159950 [Oryzias javanicus]